MIDNFAEQLQGTARRYKERAGSSHAGYVKSVAQDPRKAWLARSLSHDRAVAMVAEAEARGASNPRTALMSLAQERIIGSRDLVDMNYLEFAISVARAVCRIRIGSSAATGFLVGPGVLMTNNHVIESEGVGRQAEAQFDYQENRSGELLPVHAFRLDPSIFYLTNRTLDFTLIGVAPTSQAGRAIDQYPWLQLIGSLGKAEKDDPLNIIQHPRGGLKQIALRNNLVTDIPKGVPDFLYYTTDTEPGSSGSPCFNDQWELVALHHRGVPNTNNGDEPLKKDGTVWRDGVDDPALIHWIANEGARVSAIVQSLRAASLPAAHAGLRERVLNERPPNPIELARTTTPLVSSQNHSPQNGGVGMGTNGSSVSLSIPLNITVSLGTQTSAAAVVDTGVTKPDLAASRTGLSAGEPTEAVEIDPDWSNRDGYDKTFLGINISLPELSTAMRKITVEVPSEYRKDNDKYNLPYHHYSLAMNKKRRFAWYSAANIDGDNRPKLPPRSGDKWFIDPRIDDPDSPSIQCGEELYKTKLTDRGHLTRYLDLAWGADKAEATAATNDTFHFTNCCLELSGFNQSKDRWQGIERFLLEEKAKKERRRMVVITGPLFDDHDPFYQNEFMDYRVRIPLQFWKVCGIIRESDGKLSATAFVLGQEDVAELPGFEEKFDVTAAQITVQELENRTGLKFGTLTQHDHFAAGGQVGTLEIDQPGGGKRKVKPLRSVDDIVV